MKGSRLIPLYGLCIMTFSRTIDCHLASVFSKKLEHLSVLPYPRVTILNFSWRALLTFYQINTVMSTYTYKTINQFKQSEGLTVTSLYTNSYLKNIDINVFLSYK